MGECTDDIISLLLMIVLGLTESSTLALRRMMSHLTMKAVPTIASLWKTAASRMKKAGLTMEALPKTESSQRVPPDDASAFAPPSCHP